MRILQARILEWVAMSSSRGSSQPRDQTYQLLALQNPAQLLSWGYRVSGQPLVNDWAQWRMYGLAAPAHQNSFKGKICAPGLPVGWLRPCQRCTMVWGAPWPKLPPLPLSFPSGICKSINLMHSQLLLRVCFLEGPNDTNVILLCSPDIGLRIKCLSFFSF